MRLTRIVICAGISFPFLARSKLFLVNLRMTTNTFRMAMELLANGEQLSIYLIVTGVGYGTGCGDDTCCGYADKFILN